MTARMRMGVVLAAVLAAGVLGAPGGGAAPASAGTTGQATWVTLITGDRVAVRTVNGRTAVAVTPAPRAKPVPFQEFTQDGDQYVMPADAAALVRSGRVDDELFNVTGLVRQGYDDAHTPNIPLLVKASAPPAGMEAVGCCRVSASPHWTSRSPTPPTSGVSWPAVSSGRPVSRRCG